MVRTILCFIRSLFKRQPAIYSDAIVPVKDDELIELNRS